MAGPPEATLYRTGDLARWLPDGNVEFLGRIDRQVKVRGFRIELAEIEHRLLTHGDIKEVVVQVRDDKAGEKYLCAYYTSAQSGTTEASYLREYLSGYLPGYMIPSFFLKLKELPLTPNGKIDRKALAQYQISGLATQKGYTAPRNKKDEKMTGIWAEVLGEQKQTIGIDDNFFDIGGHSLRATIMAAKIHKEFNVKLPLAEIFKKASIRELSDAMEEMTQEEYAAIEPSEKKEYYSLTSAQKRLYVLQQMEPQSTAYNMPYTLPLAKETDRERLEEGFKKLIRRHESLRTAINMVDGTPVQVIHPTVPFKLETIRIERERQTRRPRQSKPSSARSTYR